MNIDDDAAANGSKLIVENAIRLAPPDVPYAEEGYDADDNRRAPNLATVPLSRHVRGLAIDLDVDWRPIGGEWSNEAEDALEGFSLFRPVPGEWWHVELIRNESANGATKRYMSSRQLARLYGEYLRATGVATHPDQVSQGDIFFALRRHEPEKWRSKVLWELWGQVELRAPIAIRLGKLFATGLGLHPVAARISEMQAHKYNGNAYATDALRRGARLVILDQGREHEARHFRVPCVDTAFRQLAAHHRRVLGIPIIGITGSCGKTTTKELVAAILRKKYKVFATRDNFNTLEGVCHTVLATPRDTQIGVFEMGSSGPDSIISKAEIADPDYGLITCIGKAHLLGFGGVAGVVRIKRQLFDHIASRNGHFFANIDDKNVCDIVGDYDNLWSYGTSEKAETYGTSVPGSDFLAVRWQLPLDDRQRLGCESIDIRTKLFGSMNLPNVLAAIAVGSHFGIRPEEIKSAIEAYVPDNMRSQILNRGCCTIILDAYNANPTSMTASLLDFNALRDQRKAVILGDMLELGSYSREEHSKILELVQYMQLDRAYFVGPAFSHADNSKIGEHFISVDELIESAKLKELEGACILIKGSRGIHLERCLDSIS